MIELYVPWLLLAVAIPAAGSLFVRRARDLEIARRRALWVGAVTLGCTLAVWAAMWVRGAAEARDPWNPLTYVLGDGAIAIDVVSAPLLPLAALVYLLTILATLRTKARRFPFARALVSLALLSAMLSCRAPWGIIVLSAAQCIPPFLELRERGQASRVFVVHMALFVVLLAGGWLLVAATGTAAVSLAAVAMLIAAVLIRCGAVPVHCWMTDLFERATFGTALLYVTPLAGVYVAVRLVLPVAPDWALHGMGWISLVTAVYAAGMALVQRESRRFFCYLLLSHSSLVLVGLQTATAIGLTGALSLWLAVQMSLTGFGLTLRSLESRAGRLSLADYHGFYGHMPLLAAFFLLTGLASVGFPATAGFVGAELLVEGAVAAYPYVGIAVVLAAALNGIAVMQAYFRLFTGARHTASISLRVRLPEQIAVLVVTTLILAGGLVPHPGVASRYDAAEFLLSQRARIQQQYLRKSNVAKNEEPPARFGEWEVVARQRCADCTARIRHKPQVSIRSCADP